MQGGDFVYGSGGTQKDIQQNKTSEKIAKRSDFKLSKILPSPTKSSPSLTLKENTTPLKARPDSIDTIHSEANPEEKEDDTEEKIETDEETTSDGDWYVLVVTPN